MTRSTTRKPPAPSSAASARPAKRRASAAGGSAGPPPPRASEPRGMLPKLQLQLARLAVTLADPLAQRFDPGRRRQGGSSRVRAGSAGTSRGFAAMFTTLRVFGGSCTRAVVGAPPHAPAVAAALAAARAAPSSIPPIRVSEEGQGLRSRSGVVAARRRDEGGHERRRTRAR